MSSLKNNKTAEVNQITKSSYNGRKLNFKQMI